MTDAEKIEKLEIEVSALKANQEQLWWAIHSLRQNPAMDVPRLDKVMQHRYGVRPQVIRR